MNSGLYALAGDSATATAAAWAKRLLAPVTKVSNVYFGLRRAASIVPLTGLAVPPCCQGAGELPASEAGSTGGGAKPGVVNGSAWAPPKVCPERWDGETGV